MSQNIVVKINEGKIVVKFGNQGLKGPIGPTGPTGPGGTTDHALLDHLDFSNAGHTNFQKKLNYISEYKGYEIE